MPTPPTRRCILPPDLLSRVARSGDDELRRTALDALALDATFRLTRAELTARRAPVGLRVGTVGALGGRPQRTVYDQRGSEDTRPGTLARAEGGPPSGDAAVDEAYDGFGKTYDLYWQVFARDSVDGQGLPLVGLVHFGRNYPNAFWDGQGSMFFGDGDGRMLIRTTRGLDVVGHELTHGVTQYEAGLAYSGQAGALNESISDVFGSLVKQHALGQRADEADWLIGADIVGPELSPALRSMKEPGKANPFDTQPATMDGYVVTTEDHGGVHTNSGIPNHAFHVVATTLGGYAWEAAGHIWYEALRDPRLRPTTGLRTFARTTLRQASQLYGRTSAQADAVRAGWEAVKLHP